MVDGASLRSQKVAVVCALGAEILGSLKVGVDDEQTVIVEVGHDDLIVLIEGDAARRVELLPERSVEAVLVDELAARVKQLYAMIARVGDDDVRLAGDGHVPRIVEVGTGLAALLAELEEERAVGLKDLNAMVVLVGDDDAIELVVERYARRPGELAGTRAVRAELVHELAALVKDLDAIVGAVGDDDVALFVAAHAPRPTELVVAAAAVDVEEHLAYLAVGARVLDFGR